MSSSKGQNVRYRRVQQAETDAGMLNEQKKERADRIERITAKIHAFIWVSASLAFIYFSDFVNILLYDNRVNR